MTPSLPPNCHNCPLAGQKYVGGGSPMGGCTLMIVGTAPSAEEEARGIPFTGETAAVLRELVTGMGIEKKTHFVNLVPRRPLGPTGKNRKPTAHEVDFCSRHVSADIQRLKPDLIVAVGATPYSFLVSAPRPPLALAHGLILKEHRFDMLLSVMPVYDPAYVARRGGLLSNEGKAWVDDVLFIRDHLETAIG